MQRNREKRQQALADELLQIGRYVRDNLVQIVKLCKASIVILVEVQVSGTMEARLIKDMTEDFKAQLRAARADGGMRRSTLDVSVRRGHALPGDFHGLVRDDVYSITRLYEAIHEHASTAVNRIDALMTEAKKTIQRSHEDDVALFSKLEQALLALVSDYHFELDTDLSLERDRIRTTPPGKAKRDGDALFRPLEQGAQGPQRPQDWRRAKEIQ